MSDRKINRQTRKRRSRRSTIVRSPLNSMLYQASWTVASITSGTTGTMTSWTSPSISKSSEYSIVQSLFTEVRLISARAIFTPLQSANGTVAHGALVVSTNMLQNESTGVTPTGYFDVQNQLKPIRIPTLGVKEIHYKIPVPRNLEFSNIVSDAPDPPTPWAGSPGVISWYASGVTASTAWFLIHMQCIYELRGRQ